MTAKTCAVRFETKGNSVEIIVTNTITMKEDRFVVNVDEQGSTYHILLSQVTKERLVGRAAVRELVEAIGEATEDKKLQVLIVDDDDAIRSAMTRSFKARGYEVQVAEHGLAAMDFLKANPSFDPIVILSDGDMPEMGGRDLYEVIRRTWPDLEPRFILMSGSDRHQQFAAARTIPFLSKPFTTEDLDEAIKLVRP